MIFKKATWQHLRIPFSFFLTPIYCFAISSSAVLNWGNALLIFVVLHLFLYPASNAYNSFFDKDEESIGGLEKPPPVDKEVYNAALIFDGIALLLATFLGWQFVVMILVYGLVSKAYSWDKIRLKKYPIVGWLVVCVFQGAFTYLMVKQAHLELSLPRLLELKHIFPAILSTSMLLGSYPMTQVYQHSEDAKRGDLTMSRMLGIKGTFIFTALFFSFTTAGFFYYFLTHFGETQAYLFPTFLLPVLVFFGYWFLEVLKDERNANFKRTMQLNLISAICLNAYFIFLLFE